MPTVSIIIATFNSEKTLRKALDSVSQQAFQDWECIIVDGASKDGTIDIVKEYIMSDSRFRYISEPDKGIYDAFNKGWKMAKGEWIQYLGSDDWLTEDGLKDMHLMDYVDYPIVSGDVYVVKLDGNIKLQHSIGYGGCHQGKFVKRDVLDQMNGFDESFPILADSDLMNRMNHHGYKIYNVRVNVAYFSLGGVSQNLKGEYKRAVERYRLLRRFEDPVTAMYHDLKRVANNVASQLYRKSRCIGNNKKQLGDMKPIELCEEKRLMIDILDSINFYCDENNIIYSLCGGSAIGAVRHKGFIPWDDDIDIMMLREDYERFIANYKDEKGYYRLHCLDNDPSWIYPFAKIEDTRTVKNENITDDSIVGVNVDIFPIDNLSDTKGESEKIVKRIQIYRMLLLAKIIKPTRRNSFCKRLAIIGLKMLACFLSKRYLANKITKSAKSSDGKMSQYVGCVVWGYGIKEICHSRIFSSICSVDFENRKYKIISGYDEYLKNLYGDYMTLPPENKRISPHVINGVYWK